MPSMVVVALGEPGVPLVSTARDTDVAIEVARAIVNRVDFILDEREWSFDRISNRF